MGSAAIYSRLSRDAAGDLLGVERQEEDCKAFLERAGITDAAIYRDNDESAWQKKRKRPGWDALLAAIAAGEVDTVAIYHADRLFRQPKDLEVLLDVAESRQVRILSAGGGIDLNDPTAKYILRSQVNHACLSSDDTSRRLRRKFEQMAKQGRAHGGPRPFGLDDSREGLNLPEAQAVRAVAERLLAGESLRSVTAWLNSTEFRPTGKGVAWSGPTVRQMLTRHSIAGLRVHRGEVVGQTSHPPILDVEVWQAVVALLRDPARRRAHSSARRHLLSGMATCGRCGSGLRSLQQRGHRRYWCASCMGIAIAQEPLDLFVTTAALARIRGVQRPKKSTSEGALGSRVLALRARLDEITQRAADPSASLDLLEAMGKKVTAELREAEAAQERALGAHVLTAVDESVADRWQELPLSRQRAILDALIESLVILPANGTGRFDERRISISWR